MRRTEAILRVFAVLLVVAGAAMLIAGRNSVISLSSIASGTALLVVLEENLRRRGGSFH